MHPFPMMRMWLEKTRKVKQGQNYAKIDETKKLCFFVRLACLVWSLDSRTPHINLMKYVFSSCANVGTVPNERFGSVLYL